MRALFLTTVLPGGRSSGSEVVSDNLVRALRAAGHEVTVLGYQRPGSPSPRRGETSVGRRPIETAGAGVRARAWMARGLVTGDAYSTAKYRSRAYSSAVRRALREADAVVLDHAQLHFLPCADLPVALVAHNAESALYRTLAARSRSPVWRGVYTREARVLARVEERLLRRCAHVWTLTAEDARHFRSLGAGDVRTVEVPAALDRPPPAGALTSDVAVLGRWTWEANAAGLEWFLAEVVPLIGDLTVDVAGAGSERVCNGHRSVRARGSVPDAGAFVAGARVVAVPSVAGGGVQVKTLDAIASGAPVVATATAVRGLGELPASVAVADDAAEFAAELRRLAGAPDRGRLREQSIAWSRERKARFEATVAAALDDLAGARPPAESLT